MRRLAVIFQIGLSIVIAAVFVTLAARLDFAGLVANITADVFLIGIATVLIRFILARRDRTRFVDSVRPGYEQLDSYFSRLKDEVETTALWSSQRVTPGDLWLPLGDRPFVRFDSWAKLEFGIGDLRALLGGPKLGLNLEELRNEHDQLWTTIRAMNKIVQDRRELEMSGEWIDFEAITGVVTRERSEANEACVDQINEAIAAVQRVAVSLSVKAADFQRLLVRYYEPVAAAKREVSEPFPPWIRWSTAILGMASVGLFIATHVLRSRFVPLLAEDIEGNVLAGGALIALGFAVSQLVQLSANARSTRRSIVFAHQISIACNNIVRTTHIGREERIPILDDAIRVIRHNFESLQRERSDARVQSLVQQLDELVGQHKEGNFELSLGRYTDLMPAYALSDDGRDALSNLHVPTLEGSRLTEIAGQISALIWTGHVTWVPFRRKRSAKEA